MAESDLPTQARPLPDPSRAASVLLPGTVLAGRYRIVAPLGHGGMGDVYRADDLRLGQSVALKLLPPALRGDEERRRRLRDEVRLARLVAHPNVCRVFDLVEAEGLEFLAMEYVDGENLASLLRRVGRLPEERAVRMARELCAGLAAIHDQGILHRDLKPANVMVDGRGRIRIADFGLAALAESVPAAEVSAGTPAYLAPEQREGREVTARSDVYALGLVLYEVFTGEPAYPAPSSPSSRVKDLSPAIDRTIQRCLERDATLRPPSAMAVAASLPGGDPLAAALAAGETPSPELVAAAGAGGLRPPVALACLAAVVAGTALVAFLGDRVSPFYLDLDKPPEVLAHEARGILAELGPPATAADRAHGFDRQAIAPAPEPQRIVFWYRESPVRFSSWSQFGGVLSFRYPPPLVAGMAGVVLDAHGVLVEYLRVPAAQEDPGGTPPGWDAVLQRAGLEPDTARPVPPARIPPVFADERRAWLGGDSGAPIRVEAASLRGWPVWLRVTGEQDGTNPGSPGRDASPPVWLYLIGYLIIGILLFALSRARRHVLMGRADRDGARRLAALAGFAWLFAIALFEPRSLELPRVLEWLMLAFSLAAATWIFYVALEPVVRRRWPDTLVSWTRLLRGRVRDPLVGRDVLLGVLGGVAASLVDQAGRFAQGAAAARWPAWEGGLGNSRFAASDLIMQAAYIVLESLFILLLLVLLRKPLRRTWAALALTLCVFIALPRLGNPAALISAVAVRGIAWGLLVWPGLTAGVTALLVRNALGYQLMTTHLGAWYADEAIVGIVATLALAAWGFYASLGGRPLFAEPEEAD